MTENEDFFKSKIFEDPWFDSEKIEFSDIDIDEPLGIQHNQLSLKVRHTKNQVGLLIQQYSINLLFQNLLLVKEVLIFH